MKYLIPILLFPLFAQANLRDTIPNAVPQLFGAKLYEFGNYVVVDSLLMIKGGDTTGGIPRWPALKYRVADNRWYGYFGTAYRAFLTGLDTISLSNRINSAGITLSNIGVGYRLVGSPTGNIKTISNSNTILWDSTSIANTLTAKADTSVLATQYDLTQISPGGVTQINTGYGLSGGPITSTGTIVVDTAALKSIYLPLNFNVAKTVNKNGLNVYYTGGGQDKFDSINITPSTTFGTPTILFGAGDSYMEGFRPCTPDTIFFNRLVQQYNITGNNFGVSSTGIWRADSIHNYRVNPDHSNMSFVWAGFNDIRRGGIANDTTYRKIITGLKSIIANQFLKRWIAGGASGVGVTRYGSWNTTYTCAVVGGKSPNNGAYTNTNNDSIVYLFPSPDTTVVIATINGDSHTAGFNMGTFDVYVDGVLFGHYNGLNADGISDGFYDNARTPNAIILTGLSNAIHTVKLVNTSANYLVVDYFGHMVDATNGVPLLIAHAPYNNIAGFAVSPNKGSVPAMSKLNGQIDSMVAVTATGWPIFVVPTNSYLDTLTGICTDNIHPNNAGDIQIANSVLSVLSTPNIGITNGTLAFTGSYFKGAAQGITHLIPWLDQTLQKSDTTLFVSNQTSADRNEGFRITQASTVKNKLTVGSSSLSDGSDQLDIGTTAGHMRVLGFSSQHYWQSINDANTTGIPFNFGASIIRFGEIVGGVTTNYATFNNAATNKFVITGNALINSTVRLGADVDPREAATTSGTVASLPYNSFFKSNAITDQKIWDQLVENDSVFSFRTVNDNFQTPDTINYIVRSGIRALRYVIPRATLNVGYMNMQGNGLGAYFNRRWGANKDSIAFQSTVGARHLLAIDTITGLIQRMSISNGITSINSQTGATQTIAAGTGIDVNSSSNTHTISVSTDYIIGSTYTPTITNISNIDATTAFPCQYMRIGNVVTVSGRVDIDPTAATVTAIGISLPVASAITNDYQIAGTGAIGNEFTPAAILGDATNDRALMNLTIPVTGTLSNASWFFTFTYRIL